MTSKEKYEQLYRGINADLKKWADDELQEVYNIGARDFAATPHGREALKLIKAEIDSRSVGELVR